MRKIIAITLLMLNIILSACTPVTTSTSQPVTLKIAVLPIIDTLPMYVAQQEG